MSLLVLKLFPRFSNPNWKILIKNEIKIFLHMIFQIVTWFINSTVRPFLRMWIATRILTLRWYKLPLISVTQVIMQMFLCQGILLCSRYIRRTNGISYFLAWKTLVRYDGYVIVAFIDVRARSRNLTLRAGVPFRCIWIISLPQLTDFIRAILANSIVLRGVPYKISCSTCLKWILTGRCVFLSRFASAVARIFSIIAAIQCRNWLVLQ